MTNNELPAQATQTKRLLETILAKHLRVSRSWIDDHVRFIVNGYHDVWDDARDKAVIVDAIRAPEALSQLKIVGHARRVRRLDLSAGRRADFSIEVPRLALRPPRPGDPNVGPEDLDVEAAPESFAIVAFDRARHWTPALTARGDGSTDAMVAMRRESVVALGIDLHPLLWPALIPPNLERGLSHRLDTSRVDLLERAIVDLVRDAILAAQTRIPSPPTWPHGRTWCFVVRHDYDRLVSDKEIVALLDFYDARGIRSSWYFLPHKLITHQARLIQQRGHDVGLHTTASTDDDFRLQVEALRRSLRDAPQGVTAHGGDFTGFMGGHQYRRAIESGLSYSESLGFAHGEAYVLPCDEASFVVLPSHYSLDAGTRPSQHRLDSCRAAALTARSDGRAFIVMNHPDIHSEEMMALVEDVVDATAWCATASQLASWTLRRTDVD